MGKMSQLSSVAEQLGGRNQLQSLRMAKIALAEQEGDLIKLVDPDSRRFGCFTHQWDSRYRVTSGNIFWLARSKFCDYRERTLPLREK